MRQDPDIIFLGEVRDEETAVMAVRAALTGHQVFTTLHTNDALGAIPRLGRYRCATTFACGVADLYDGATLGAEAM
jgi:type II secretory ATPase GspE/PulE/Tfp pilus assembly ATPase PilB-like protein